MSQIVALTPTWQQDKVEGNPMGANTASNAKNKPQPSAHRVQLLFMRPLLQLKFFLCRQRRTVTDT